MLLPSSITQIIIILFCHFPLVDISVSKKLPNQNPGINDVDKEQGEAIKTKCETNTSYFSMKARWEKLGLHHKIKGISGNITDHKKKNLLYCYLLQLSNMVKFYKA